VPYQNKQLWRLNPRLSRKTAKPTQKEEETRTTRLLERVSSTPATLAEHHQRRCSDGAAVTINVNLNFEEVFRD